MHASRNSFLDHVKWLRKAVLAAGAELLFAGDSLRALVRQGERHWVLHPRFLTRSDGVLRMTPQLHDTSELFLGWLPYPARGWPIATDTLAFKRFARSIGLPTPEFFTEPAPALVDVVVTRTAPSLARRAEGPFRSASERPLDASKGEYYERFIDGDLLTVWFWNGDPICAERQTTARGGADRVSSARERLEGRDGDDGADPAPRTAGSPDTGWIEWMRSAGRQLLAGIPESIRATTLFTLDAILDAEHRPWLLQMDGNPSVHPLAYPTMIESLLAPERHASPAPSQQPA